MPGGPARNGFIAQKLKRFRKGKRREDDELGGYFSGRNPFQKPADLERQADHELKEEIIRNLTTDDPTKVKNLVIWGNKEREFLPVEEAEEKVITVLYLESVLIEKDSEETNELKDDGTEEFSDSDVDDKKPEVPVVKPLSSGELIKKPVTETENGKEEKAPPAEAEEPEEKEEKEDAIATEGDDRPKKLLNQFNFCERGAQTNITGQRNMASQTEPPSRANYRDMCNSWIIHDAYQLDAKLNPVVTVPEKVLADFPKSEATVVGEGEEEGEEGGDKERDEISKDTKKKESEKDVQIVHREKVKMRKALILEGQAAIDMALLKAAEGLKYMERIVNSNMNEEIVEDFKYFEDNADEYRESGEGTLLPLWKFSYDRAKKMHATCISWSLTQPDMCAVSYGSFSFMYPILDGMVVIYSLRNPSYPEHAWLAPKGAMTCHVHPQKNMLVCVGLYDGNTAVLNLEKNEDNESRTQIFKNIPTSMKHHGPVWSVKWSEDDLDGDPTFYSAGMDGRVILWKIGIQDIYGNGGLEGSEVCTLFLPIPKLSGPDGITYKLFGCARCLAFHPKDRNTYLVGTAEGNIFQCCALYSSKFEKLYSAHFLPVASIQWNHFHFDVFLSCSEDWTIKVWDRRDSEPMYVFEIGVPILDICWAPYSSTVFGTVIEEGKVLIYDLNVNKEKPICTQQVVTKRKVRPHRIKFNPVYPIIIVADDRGQLSSLKLSPNLRILPKDSRNILLEGEAREKYEINKMSKLLSLVRDPDGLTKPKGTRDVKDLKRSNSQPTNNNNS